MMRTAVVSREAMLPEESRDRMSLIIRDVELQGREGSLTVRVLFDSGATFSLIRRDVAERLGGLFPQHPVRFREASGRVAMESREMVLASFEIEGFSVNWPFYVLDQMGREAIIGVDLLQLFRIKLDFQHDAIIVDPEAMEAIVM